MANNHKIPAAYQGNGWLPREKNMSCEIQEGRIWSAYSSSSEYHPLKAVLLHIPDPDIPETADANRSLHLASIDYRLLYRQINDLADIFSRFGIDVHFMKPDSADDKVKFHKSFHNLMFVRDLFFMTPEGAVISRMASEIRAGEERCASKALVELGIPVLCTISGKGTLEGADAFWVNEKRVLVGTGNRTNEAGFNQLKSCLKFQGVEAIRISLPKGIMHLMGIFQIVDRDLALIRSDFIKGEIIDLIERQGFQLIKMNETDEIKRNQAMNIVTLAPRKIVMVAGNPLTRRIYEENGIEVAAGIEVSELVKGAGGIGCATGILHRQSLNGL